MSGLAAALLAELDDQALDELAALLAPRLAQLATPVEDRAADELLTAAEAAGRAKAHVETIRRAVRSGDLPAQRIGRALRIAAGDLDRWLTGAEPVRTVGRPRSRPRSSNRRPLAGALSNLDTRR
jgi:excisionase family DNA binding protein